ncbi:MAG: lysostaphin resistance A-like protein [Oscillospiraceae bacterium]
MNINKDNFNLDYLNNDLNGINVKSLKNKSKLINSTLLVHILGFMIMPFIFVYTIQKILPFLINTFPDAVFLREDYFWNYLINIVTLSFINVIPFMYVLKKTKFNYKSFFSFDGFKIKKAFKYCFIGLGLNYFVAFLAVNLTEFLKKFNINAIEPDLSAPKDSIITTVLYVFMIIVVAPITEEFLCRGAILNLLKPYGKKFSIIISAAVFSILHGNLFQMPGSFILGLFLGYLAIKYDSIIMPIIVHFMNNFLSVIISIFLLNKNIENTEQMAPTDTFIIGLYSTFILFCFIYSGYKIFKNIGKKPFKGDIKIKGRYKIFVSNIFFPLLFILYLIRFLNYIKIS